MVDCHALFGLSSSVFARCVWETSVRVGATREAHDLSSDARQSFAVRLVAGDGGGAPAAIGSARRWYVVQTHARKEYDRAALDGRSVDHAPLDVHVGSIALRRLIEARQPLLTLHGHVHESARLTGRWRERIGRTHCLGAAHDGEELALIRFDPDDLERATRELL